MELNKKKAFKLTIGISIIIWCLFSLYRCASIDSCLDFGDVWDYAENRCRKDCLVWNQYYGCVQMNEEQLAIFNACSYNPATCDHEKRDQMYQDLCERYHAPIDPETGSCTFEKPPVNNKIRK